MKNRLRTMSGIRLILGILAVWTSHGQAQDAKPPVHYYNPDWSPDGSTIAFESDWDGREAVYAIQVDGGNLRQLTRGENNPSAQPRWSSDGRRIVFISSREGHGGLFLMNADGLDQRRVTTSVVGDFVPVLSPQGNLIAFVSSDDDRTRTTDVYVVRTDGTGRTRLTNCEESVCGGIEWSPDGRQILFSKVQAMPQNFPSLSAEERTAARARVQGSGDIFLMNSDGSHLRGLTHNDLGNGSARWSTNGRRIEFVSRREGTSLAYAMDLDGSHVRLLADRPMIGDSRASGDGKYLAYSKDADRHSALFIYDKARGIERRLIGQ